MFKVEHLAGIPWGGLGKQDCYSTIQAFYRDNFNLQLRNYARPNDFWDHGLDLYIDNFRSEGFKIVNDHPKDWRPGDLILMAIRAPLANHAAILLEDGQILHHLYGCLSTIESYNRPLFRDTTVAVIRHPAVQAKAPPTTLLDLKEVMPDAVRSRIFDAVPDAGRA